MNRMWVCGRSWGKVAPMYAYMCVRDHTAHGQGRPLMGSDPQYGAAKSDQRPRPCAGLRAGVALSVTSHP